MTCMTNKVFVNFCILLLCTSCNYISYSQIAPMVKTAILGVDDIVIDEEYINNKEYSFAKVKIGKSGIAIMTLSQINDGIYSWISSSGEKLNTFNGKVVSISGSLFDMKIYNYSNFALDNNFAVSLNAQMILESPKAFIDHFSSTKFITLTDEGLIYYEEAIVTKGFKWNFTNSYWVDPVTKRVTRTLQYVHPKQPQLEISFFYK